MQNFSPELLTFHSSGTAEANAALARLRARYGDVGAAKAEVVVALGGDGTMLQALREVMERRVPVFGMNCGSVGFLMNDSGIIVPATGVALVGPLLVAAVARLRGDGPTPLRAGDAGLAASG